MASITSAASRTVRVNGVQAWVKNLAGTPAWAPLGTRPPEMARAVRSYANATLLPTGQVFVSGGVRPPQEHDAMAVLNAEVYDPDTNAWQMTSAATVPRNYHGVAVLAKVPLTDLDQEVVPGTARWPHVDAPAGTARALLDWWSRQAQPASASRDPESGTE